MSEHDFQQRLLLALGSRRDLVVARMNSGTVPVCDDNGQPTGRVFRAGPVGIGDIMLIVAPDGWHVEIECKTAKGKQRDSQKAREKRLRELGAIYLVARESDGVEATVTRIDQEIERKRAGHRG